MAKAQMLKTGIAQLLEKRPTTAAEKDAYIHELQNTLKDVTAEVADLQEMVQWLRKQMYGSKSEKTPVPDEKQLGIFNEAEQEYKPEVPEPIKKDKRGYHIKTPEERWKLVGGKDITFEDRILALQGKDLICTHCGTEMICIGKETVREIPEFVPAKLKIVRYIQPTYCCPCCKKKGIVRIAKYPVPKPLLNHSMASASVVAEVMYQKYVQAVSAAISTGDVVEGRRDCVQPHYHGELGYPMQPGLAEPGVRPDAEGASGPGGPSRRRNSDTGAEGNRQDHCQQKLYVGLPHR